MTTPTGGTRVYTRSMAVATAAAAREAQRFFRVASSLAHEWAGRATPNMPERHGLRTARVERMWPDLAWLLNALMEVIPSPETEQAILRGTFPRCPRCGGDAVTVNGAPDPRTARLVYRVGPCGHDVTATEAEDLWGHGATMTMTPVDGAALIRAEVRRQREDKGFTREHDAHHDPGDLAWAAWCILDRIGNPDAEGVPPMWPWEPETWKWERWSPQRALVIAGALIAAELDRVLADEDGQEVT